MQVRIQYTRVGWVLLKPFVSLASASMTGTQSHLVHDDRDAELGLVRLVGVVVVVIIAGGVGDDQKAKQISFFLLLLAFCVFLFSLSTITCQVITNASCAQCDCEMSF